VFAALIILYLLKLRGMAKCELWIRHSSIIENVYNNNMYSYHLHGKRLNASLPISYIQRIEYSR
jgi:hypothetical protein